jgi:hypothetical protein
MTNVAYTHLGIPNNSILSDAKLDRFRLAGRRISCVLIGAVRFVLRNARSFRVGITILGELISRTAPPNIPDDLAAEVSTRAIEVAEASAGYQVRSHHAQRSTGARQLRPGPGEQEQTR